MSFQVQRECKLDVNVDEYVESTVRPYLMDVIYCWSKVSSEELCYKILDHVLQFAMCARFALHILLHKLNVRLHHLFSRLMSSVNFESVFIMFEQNLGEEKKYIVLGMAKGGENIQSVSQARHAQIIHGYQCLPKYGVDHESKVSHVFPMFLVFERLV